MGATIASGLREAITNAINDTGFMNKIENMIGDKICGFSLGDVLSGKLSSGEKQKLSTEITKAETNDPDIFTKAMKSGLSNILNF
jgi:hypothetical protein